MRDPRLLYPITHGSHASSSAQPSLPAPATRPVVRPASQHVPYSTPSGLVVPDPSRAIIEERSSRAPEVVPGGYPLWELPAPLRRLCESLEAATEDGEIPLETMRAMLDGLENDLQMLAPWWIFDACNYRRNLIRRTPAYEALLLCWLPGQRSPIHDHRGSGCAFRVIEGVVTETLYEPEKSGGVTAASMRWLPPGTICASREFDIHEVANTQPHADLVTLHVYSPPLRDVNLYRASDPAPAS
jgi:cysteine dioxygenase